MRIGLDPQRCFRSAGAPDKMRFIYCAPVQLERLSVSPTCLTSPLPCKALCLRWAFLFALVPRTFLFSGKLFSDALE